jgi:hypothetical protein
MMDFSALGKDSKCNSSLSTAISGDLNILVKQAHKNLHTVAWFSILSCDRIAIDISVTKQRTVAIRALSQGHTVSQPLKKFTGYYGILNFIRARHCSQTLRQIYTLRIRNRVQCIALSRGVF